jgi:hypothetical protein
MLRTHAAAIAVLAVVVGSTPLLADQDERVTIRFSPAPRQTYRQQMVEEVDMSTDASAPAPNGVTIPPMRVQLTIDVSSAVDVGAPRDDGDYEATVTVDAGNVSMMLNGQPFALPGNNPAAAIAGQQMTIVYTAAGAVRDVQSSSRRNASSAMLRQFLAGMTRPVATVELGVGESTTIPGQFALPIPTGNARGMNAETTSTLTLRGVETGNGHRIAHLDVATTGRFDAAGSVPTTADNGTVAMTMNGTGTMDVDLERGVTTGNDQRIVVELNASSATSLSAHLKGTVHLVVTERP